MKKSGRGGLCGETSGDALTYFSYEIITGYSLPAFLYGTGDYHETVYIYCCQRWYFHLYINFTYVNNISAPWLKVHISPHYTVSEHIFAALQKAQKK
jgi:hypothetical protein